VEITFDPAKNERNIRERGISLERATDFNFETAIYVQDSRKDYGETRIRAFEFIGDRLHALVITVRGTALRIISLRKANRREVERYEKAAKPGNDR
jgi:uncharacterized DUF497 family protein